MYALTKWIRSVLYLPLPGGKKLWFLTAAEALAMTEARVSAGDLAMVIDQGGRIVEVQTPGPASTTWAQRVTEIVRCDAASSAAALRYWSANTTGISATIASTNRLLTKWPGEVRSYTYRGANNIVSVALGVHLDLNTTPVETHTHDPAAGVLFTQAFTASTFTADQVLTFSETPSADPGIHLMIVEIEYLVPLAA